MEISFMCNTSDSTEQQKPNKSEHYGNAHCKSRTYIILVRWSHHVALYFIGKWSNLLDVVMSISDFLVQ